MSIDEAKGREPALKALRETYKTLRKIKTLEKSPMCEQTTNKWLNKRHPKTTKMFYLMPSQSIQDKYEA